MSASEPGAANPEQGEWSERLAKRRGVSVGSVIREAIDAYTAPWRRTRSQALEALFGLEAPVDEWMSCRNRSPGEPPLLLIDDRFVDTAVIMYAGGREHSLREPCRTILRHTSLSD